MYFESQNYHHLIRYLIIQDRDESNKGISPNLCFDSIIAIER
jgi:hypothetical protein